MTSPDEFYIGWQSRAPVGLGAHVRKTVCGLLGLILGAGLLFAVAQRTIGVAVFEWGTVKTFTGLFQSGPYPQLLVQRPGSSEEMSSYYLVAPFKFGLKPETVAAFEGRQVTLQGTLIYRGNQTMIEARPDTIKVASSPPPHNPHPAAASYLGRQTVVGEIVDSKCYLGVMNPGRLAPHRACAVRCISGGIPPVLVVRQAGRPPLYYLLVSANGRPVNQQVLDMVAEPVQITGEVIRQGELLILRADPSTYRRVGS